MPEIPYYKDRIPSDSDRLTLRQQFAEMIFDRRAKKIALQEKYNNQLSG